MNLRRLILSVVLAFLGSAPALAGNLEVKDEPRLLSPADVSTLRARVQTWPFDARVLVSTSAPNKSAFEQRAAAAVSSPRLVVIGVDPAHRFTVVRFGVSVGISSDEWPGIAAAGNGAFKRGAWADGIADIGQRAAERSTQARIVLPPVSAPQSVTTTTHTTETVIRTKAAPEDSGAPVAILLPVLVGVLAFVGLILWLSHRSRRKAEADPQLRARVAADLFATTGAAPPRRRTATSAEPATERRAAAVSSAPAAPRVHAPAPAAPVIIQRSSPPVVVQSAPSVVHHHHDHGSDLLTGMLIGQSLGHHHEPVREREVVREVRETRVEARRDPTPVRSYDSGGSSSSWSSSSDDSGGSSSSWDSGSSSSYDSGGGGSSDW